jgi:hypothetical protein
MVPVPLSIYIVFPSTLPLKGSSQVAYLRVDLSMELAVEDFSGGEVEELILSWFEIIELVITFFCCKKPKTITMY